MRKTVGLSLTALLLTACTPSTLSNGPSAGHLRAEDVAKTPGNIPAPVQQIASLPRPKPAEKTETYSVVVKIGTTALTTREGRFDANRLQYLVDAIEARMGEHWERPTGAAVGRIRTDLGAIEAAVDEIIAAKEAEEAAARARDEHLADPNWKEEPVEPGDQDPNAPFRTPAEHADRSDMPTQAEVNAEIDREDDMDSSADAPDPDKRD